MEKNITMNNKIFEMTQLLTDEFTDKFSQIYEPLSSREQNNLMYFSSPFFLRWYHSSLLNETTLSPANIITDIFSDKSNTPKQADTYFSLGIHHTAPDKSFSFNLCFDSGEKSTFIEDLRSICNFCFPSGELYPKKQAWFKNAKDLRNRVSLDDPFYINYLLEMALSLGLIKQMPSIGNVTVYQYIKSKGETFFSMSIAEAMKKVYNTALNIFKINLINDLDIPPEAISLDYVKSFLKENRLSDDLLADILSRLDIDYKELTELAKSENLNEDDEALVSSAVFLGGSVGKWLFIPLGSYMRLINPLYSLPMDFTTEADFLLPFMHLDCDLTCEIFTCCNYFSLTPLGQAVIEPTAKYDIKKISSSDFTISKLKDLLDASNYFKSLSSAMNEIELEGQEAYTFKVYFKSDRTMWKTFEVLSENTLADLAKTVDNFIGILDNNNYDISYNGVEYSLKSSKRSLVKAENTLLKTLELEPGSKILYSNHYNKSDNLVIEFISSSPAEPARKYPRLIKQSQKITESERNDF